LADVAAVALVVWDQVLSVGQRATIARGLGVDASAARSLVGLWAGLHDLGKVSPGFQAMDETSFAALIADSDFACGPVGGGLRHERAAQLVLPELLEGVGYSTAPWRSSTAYRCAQIVGGHHGRFGFTAERDCRRALMVSGPELGAGRWQAERVSLFEVMFEVLGRPRPPERIPVEVAVLVSAVIVVADWLASQESFLKARQATAAAEVSATAVGAHFRATGVLAPGVLAAAGLGRIGLRDEPFDRVFGWEPNPLQRSMLAGLAGRVQGAGLLVVTAATGDGKTEAALAVARMLGEAAGVSGVYFALPTMATTDQMYGRVAEFARRCVDGPASLAVLHSMAWLGRDDIERQLALPAGTVLSDDPDLGSGFRVAGTDWLYGRHRGLLAGLAVGTIDQALLAVLRAKYSMMRMLGLSSKVFVVDEAHAYDPYMQKLLRQLLVWLGRLGCPVVLLSATLPSSVTRRLIEGYCRGAGRAVPSDLAVRYPGWVFVPADEDQDGIEISERAHQQVARHRRFELAVDVRRVRSASRAETVPDRGTRAGVLREVLAGVAGEGGCAAVVCNTVQDAQDTYADLAAWLGGIGSRVELHLLHARMPAWMREQRTDRLIARYGKNGSRPAGIVVATQVIEQSLDLDFDLLVSDLAPVALLLQRAGRCWRHVRDDRPGWSRGARLVVLDPVDGAGAFAAPQRWGGVYSPFLLRATHHALAGRVGAAIQVPGDVQGLVEAVYEQGLAGVPGLVEDPAAAADYDDYRADDAALRGVAGMGVVPEPGQVTDLKSLHEDQVAEVEVATRFGAESVKVIACFQDTDGGQWLDTSRAVPVPARGSRSKGRFTDDEVRALLRHAIPLRADYLAGAGPDQSSPPAWLDNVWLRDVRLLRQTITGTGAAEAAIGGRRFRLDQHLGLVIS
jgi:CRISPR-associated endonuclease/helicase Cas3